jgi:hypothetical protein
VSKKNRPHPSIGKAEQSTPRPRAPESGNCAMPGDDAPFLLRRCVEHVSGQKQSFVPADMHESNIKVDEKNALRMPQNLQIERASASGKLI